MWEQRQQQVSAHSDGTDVLGYISYPLLWCFHGCELKTVPSKQLKFPPCPSISISSCFCSATWCPARVMIWAVLAAAAYQMFGTLLGSCITAGDQWRSAAGAFSTEEDQKAKETCLERLTCAFTKEKDLFHRAHYLSQRNTPLELAILLA